jgi:hypothetical protein
MFRGRVGFGTVLPLPISPVPALNNITGSLITLSGKNDVASHSYNFSLLYSATRMRKDGAVGFVNAGCTFRCTLKLSRVPSIAPESVAAILVST